MKIKENKNCNIHSGYLIPIFVILLTMLTACKKDLPLDENTTNAINYSEFEKIYGGAGDDYSYSGVITPNEHILISGATSSQGKGGSDGLLLLLDNQGEVLSETTYGTFGEEAFHAINKSGSGNYILAGYQDSISQGNKNVYLVEADESGRIIMETAISSSSLEEASAVITTPDKNYLILGRSEESGNIDVLLQKVSNEGKLIWSKKYGGPQTDAGTKIIPTFDGNYYLYCYTYSFGAGNRDILLMKVNEQGDSLWSKTYGSSAYEQTGSIIANPFGEFYMFGHSNKNEPNHQAHLMKIDNSGNLLLEKEYGGNSHEGGEDILLSPQGDLVLLANTNSQIGRNEEIYLLKTNSEGQIKEERFFGSTSNDTGHKIITHKDGYLIIATTMRNGNRDIYLVRTK